jgi:NADPH2:quinone reductase
MRAIQITELTGPATAVRLANVPEPELGHELTPGEGVLIEVHAAGVAFPDVLQTRGLYQVKPELPFIPGVEVAGIVRSAPAGARVEPGDRVAAFTFTQAYAEFAVAPAPFVFKLPETLHMRQGAALILNYHTSYFALVTRGRLADGETVLVHGAAGGVGTASLQIARGLGARTIAVVSSDAKAKVAHECGADHVLRSDSPWKDEVKALGGADIVIDPVGGDRFTDSLRSLRGGGRLVVVGFAEGSIPEVRVNRLLLGNTEVVGAGWGGYVRDGTWTGEVSRQEAYVAEVATALDGLIAAGYVRPIVGAHFPLERAADALTLIDERGATGKVVLDVQPDESGSPSSEQL